MEKVYHSQGKKAMKFKENVSLGFVKKRAQYDFCGFE